ncbi:YqiA/YcfP family alpha/beta fold hydrolase [Azohydromonas caseinilytica]|uniref:Esterase n=1 Tax=Azohydromonas caseinilytica TaxID=2728836 RepID=A0A848FAC4_9BURK|nr:YqiA/YcfP family alpha/beta fold hydrolase [Azohydromonas caseinilytica]NML15160.1 esterase [Azohydromonas caseinilytica]
MNTPARAPTHLLYLHGFRSSPRSFKAQRMAAWMQAHRPDVHWWCPQLPPSPREAVDLLLQGTAAWPRDGMAVVGSSLGGFYATVLAERLGCRAVLINPAVEPARDLAKYIGEQTAFHDPQQHFFFRAEFVDELRALQPPALTQPQRYLALIATGDEVLDWREMAARYAACHPHVIQGSDHALSDFDAHLPRLLGFLGLQNASS